MRWMLSPLRGFIEVARGAGASLTTPEAMGGVINIITKEATENGGTLDVSAGENGFRQVGFMATGITDDERTRVTLVGQYDKRDQFDADNNHVSESPFQKNRSVALRLSQDFTTDDNLVLRYSHVFSEIFGGPVLGKSAKSIRQAIGSEKNGAAPTLFAGDNVNGKFIGQPWETTEWIETRRDEYSASWIHEFDDQWSMKLSGSYSDHVQDSFYEGFDYYGRDRMHYYDIRFNYALNDEHMLAFGVDTRSDKLRSSSAAGQANANYISDSFDYETKGIYFQDRWTPSDWMELAIAVRVDKVEADFIDPSKPGTEIDETVVSPRLDGRFFHNDQWTSRVSVGRGYRAPLSFFETDHGILDGNAGYAIDVDSLERSLTGSYALTYEGDRLTCTLSVAWTEVGDLAGVDETPAGVPLLTQSDEDASVTAIDLALGYQLTDELLVNLVLENINYDSAFKSSYAVAPIEQRATLSLDYNAYGWDIYLSTVWVGSRDLDEYGYEGTDVLGSNRAKTVHAPSYITSDLRISKELTSSVSIYLGVNNMFDYTQADDESSPLFFDAVGDPGAGYDVAYIYGPLRGREVYAGMKWSF